MASNEACCAVLAVLPMSIRCTRPSVSGSAASFDFNKYMMDRAVLVNKALDEAVPQKYPDTLYESMRSVNDSL